MAISGEPARPPGLERNVLLAALTTLGTGGPARWYLDLDDTRKLTRAVAWAEGRRLPVLFLGEGSSATSIHVTG